MSLEETAKRLEKQAEAAIGASKRLPENWRFYEAGRAIAHDIAQEVFGDDWEIRVDCYIGGYQVKALRKL